MTYPQHFIKTVTSTFDGGDEWLQNLPEIIAQCEAKWNLTAHEHFPALSYNYAAPATMADGTAVVLKIGVPRDELITEMDALKLYDGRAICRLIDADMKMGVLIIEQLAPGKMLLVDTTDGRIVEDEEAKKDLSTQ